MCSSSLLIFQYLAGELGYRIDFFPVLPCEFNQLIAHQPHPNFSTNAYHGQLTSNPDVLLGSPRSLKTAHPGRLSIVFQANTTASMLGSVSNDEVAVKRPYF
jgi:hypothetical protein